MAKRPPARPRTPFGLTRRTRIGQKAYLSRVEYYLVSQYRVGRRDILLIRGFPCRFKALRPRFGGPVATAIVESRDERRLAVRYEVRAPDGKVVKQLDGHPLAVEPPRLARVIANGLAVFVCFVLAGLIFVGVAPRLWGWQPVTANSNAMAPAIRSHDVVLTAPSNGSDLGEGTIVHYHRDGESVLGRIAAKTDDGYLIALDGNVTGIGPGAIVEVEPVAAGDVRGVGVIVVPWIGLPIVWLQQGLWFKLAVLAAGLAALVYMSRRRWVEPSSEWSSA